MNTRPRCRQGLDKKNWVEITVYDLSTRFFIALPHLDNFEPYWDMTSYRVSCFPCSPLPGSAGPVGSVSIRIDWNWSWLRETDSADRFFAASGVEIAQHHQDLIRLRRAAFYSQLKSKVGDILTKATALRIDLNFDGAPMASHTLTPLTHKLLVSYPRSFP
jgi:hypothetical protein